jgi:hypothetical protein
MSLYSLFETVDNLENEGIFLEISPGVKFKVRRMGGKNKKYSEVMAKLSRPYKRQIDQGLLEEQTARKLLQRAFIRTVLCGWEGVTDKNGVDLQYTEENAETIFTDLPDLFDVLQEEAQKLSNFKEEEIGDTVKN